MKDIKVKMFGFLRKKKQSNPAEDQEKRILEYILNMHTVLSEKCKSEDGMPNIHKLDKPERIFFIAMEVDMEVGNGGFDQLFYNSAGDYAYQMEAAFLEIGAEDIAKICKKALGVFKDPLPEDWFHRQEYLETMREDYWGTVWDECDEQFYKIEYKLPLLLYDYIQKNSDFFPVVHGGLN